MSDKKGTIGFAENAVELSVNELMKSVEYALEYDETVIKSFMTAYLDLMKYTREDKSQSAMLMQAIPNEEWRKIRLAMFKHAAEVFVYHNVD